MIVKGAETFNRKISNILIIQLGDIGDVVWSTPTFKAVKDAYPQAKVSVLLRDGFGSLLMADPSLNRIFEIKRYEGNILNKARAQCSFIRNLRKEHFDLVFDLRLDDRGAYMAFISGAPIRVSMIDRHSKWRNRLFTHLVDPAPLDKTSCTAADQSLRIIREFGIEPTDAVPRLRISKEDDEWARRLSDYEELSDNRWITLNPFSRWQYKEWSYNKWIQIIDWLWKDYGITVLILGSAEEKERSEYIVNKCHGRVFNLTGKTTLDKLAGILRYSYLHIGVDSAAPHIAAAVGTSTITIYGPSDWRDWAPRGKKHCVVIPDDICVPCQQKGCDGSGQSKCLEHLTVSTVKKVIQEFLNKRGLSHVN